jgi:tRNA(fMet)-specific endonuclease VapC
VSLRYLLDTNVVSEALRPAPNEHIIQHLKLYEHALAIPAVVWHELWYGCRRLPVSAKRTIIERYLVEVIGPSMTILAYDAQAAHWHALERARLAALGHLPPFADGQIAAIAAVNGLALVTSNVKDFAQFSDIQVVNWQ